jgi:uncharacterized protein (DUF983 family)
MLEPAMASRRPALLRAIGRGLARRCPRCAEGRIIAGFYRVAPACPACGLDIEGHEDDHLGFMYLSNVVLTGFFIIGMLMVRPRNVLLGQVVIGLVALAVMGLSLPLRKGFSIALAWWLRAAQGEDSRGRPG